MRTEPGAGDHGPRQGRRESQEERADRRWSDLLQEVRVALTGVQVLFGFLLTVAFQQRFPQLPVMDRNLYLVTIGLAGACIACLIGPVALHRMLTGRKVKPQTVDWAARLTVAGLALLLCTMGSTFLLVMHVVLGDTIAVWLTVPVVVWFLLCWLLLPLWVRRDGDDRDA
ncbi:DUF6328 family protein [Streptomyces sp. NPDC004539]|uniref:DUF6328 family protein n=1 Tax=Streptomyces sp. NPDC004539 TaxID=3154280 RepID=UPI0033BAFFAB